MFMSNEPVQMFEFVFLVWGVYRYLIKAGISVLTVLCANKKEFDQAQTNANYEI